MYISLTRTLPHTLILHALTEIFAAALAGPETLATLIRGPLPANSSANASSASCGGSASADPEQDGNADDGFSLPYSNWFVDLDAYAVPAPPAATSNANGGNVTDSVSDSNAVAAVASAAVAQCPFPVTALHLAALLRSDAAVATLLTARARPDPPPYKPPASSALTGVVCDSANAAAEDSNNTDGAEDSSSTHGNNAGPSVAASAATTAPLALPAMSPLSVAVYARASISLVTSLLTARASVNAVDPSGRRPLHYAFPPAAAALPAPPTLALPTQSSRSQPQPQPQAQAQESGAALAALLLTHRAKADATAVPAQAIVSSAPQGTVRNTAGNSCGVALPCVFQSPLHLAVTAAASTAATAATQYVRLIPALVAAGAEPDALALPNNSQSCDDPNASESKTLTAARQVLRPRGAAAARALPASAVSAARLAARADCLAAYAELVVAGADAPLPGAGEAGAVALAASAGAAAAARAAALGGAAVASYSGGAAAGTRAGPVRAGAGAGAWAGDGADRELTEWAESKGDRLRMAVEDAADRRRAAERDRERARTMRL